MALPGERFRYLDMNFERDLMSTVWHEASQAREREVRRFSEMVWAAYLIEKHYPISVAFDTNRPTSHQAESSESVWVEIPVIPNETWDAVASYGNLAIEAKEERAKEGTALRRLRYDGRGGRLCVLVKATDPEAIRIAEDWAQDLVAWMNRKIRELPRWFPASVRATIRERQSKLKLEDDALARLEQKARIQLIRERPIRAVIPTAVEVKRRATELSGRTRTLDEATCNEIVEVIDNQGRQFELTPAAFRRLPEEGLRDVLLSSLNAVFKVPGTGETFRRLGKVDIHLPIGRRDVFVAELKVWSGARSLSECLRQLRERLTWRDSYGVAIILGRREKNFGGLLERIERAISSTDGFVPSSFRKLEKHHFAGRFFSLSSKSSMVELHILVYDLYLERQARRMRVARR